MSTTSSLATDFDIELTDRARQDTIDKYRSFIDELYRDLNIQNDKLNLNNLFSCLNLFNFPRDLSLFTVGQKRSSLILEHTNYFELLQTCGNTQLNKMMLVFATLTEELNHLTQLGLQRFVSPILLYREDNLINSTAKEALTLDIKKGDFSGGDDRIEEEDEYSAVAAILPLLFDLICYLKRCYEVAGNLIHQMHSLLNYANFKTKDKDFMSNLREVLPDLTSNIRFDICWESLSNMAITLINLDQIFVLQSNALRRDIINYKRSLEMLLKSLDQFELNSKENEIQAILTVIVEVERELLEAGIAGNMTEPSCQDIDYLFFKGLIVSFLNLNISENCAIQKNIHLNENMAAYVKQVCSEMEQNHEKFVDDYRLLSTVIFYSIYVHMFWRDSDKKLLKLLTDVQRKLGVVFAHLQGNISISPDQVLISTLPKQLMDKKTCDYFVTQRELLMKTGHVDGQVKSLKIAISQCLVSMEQSFNSGFYNNTAEGDTLNLIFTHVQQMKECFDYVRQLSSLVRNSIAVHYQCARSLAKVDTIALCKAVQLLKGLQRFCARHKKMLLEVTTHYQKYNACALLNILTRTKRKLMGNVTNYSEQKLDLLSALILAANCLNGPVMTSQRYTLTSLCLSYTTPYTGLFTQDDLAKIQILFRRIHYFTNIFTVVARLLNCDFLYFNREIEKVYIRHFYESFSSSGLHAVTLHELQYFFSAIDDALPMFESLDNEVHASNLIDAYLEDVLQVFKMQFLNPICKDFEDELRFLTHLDLQVGEKSPFQRNFKDFKTLLAAEPLKLAGGRKIIWIKSFVENYLNELAYNMTTIALHDWKTYESMLGFARAKFDLEFASLQLPTQTLEQGLDVLEITRNIHIFVAAYLYNLNNQLFVERSSANKHLNVLTIRHVANSIQTHGFGIINSTVNFAYQFLKKKLQTLSQFLFEEHIKSRLIKDIRQFREMVAEEEAKGPRPATRLVKFSFDRAEKFVKGIRRLGVTKEGLSYLDKFRQLLTQIGNVLGFVRMLRSGALHCTSEIAHFVPDLDDLGQVAFQTLIDQESDQFSKESIEAAKNLDSVLSTVATNFSDATDYFKLLIEVFAPTFRDPKHMHLKNFYVILPATTYNFVEHITICKEKLARKNIKDGAAFTDDGFSMGVIYVLRLLDQLQDFDSLQWFSSVDEHVQQSMPSLQSTLDFSQSTSSEDKSLQTRNLTIKRLEMFHKEFKLLSYNMTSCRILFESSSRQH